MARTPEAARPVHSSFFEEKVALRERALGLVGSERPRVLDCFAAAGLIWGEVASRVPCEVTHVEIDPMVAPPGAIVADNMAVLRSRDISGYDLIDLDAYGWPDEQLDAIAWRRAGDLPIVTITCAGTQIGRVPRLVLDAAGVPASFPPGVVSRDGPGWWTCLTQSLGWSTVERWQARRRGGSWVLYETLQPQIR